MNKSIAELLKEYSALDYLPMHMPGHKRQAEAFSHLSSLGARLDITEIDSFDDLNCPEGIFAESERLAASLWGSGASVYSVNGSTGAILASVRAALSCRRGARVVLSRACHKAVYHALEICGAEAHYLSPRLTEAGFCASVTPDEVKESLEMCGGADLVIITSPTYEGIISDVRGIAEVCHGFGVPLMVDEAHGAHLGLHGVFPDGAVRCGADVVVQSLHKTLPSLTQTAIVHLNSNLVDECELRRQMALFQTSSPSYILSASVDGAVRYLASDDGKARLGCWYDAVTEARGRLINSGCELYVPCDAVFGYDESKLVLLGNGYGIMKRLREEYKIELEMASVSYAVAMTGIGDDRESLGRFVRAVEDLGNVPGSNEAYTGRIHIPECACSICDAVSRESTERELETSCGQVSASYVYAYPPGIPLAVPGEVIDGEVIRSIEILRGVGADLRGVKNGKILTLK